MEIKHIWLRYKQHTRRCVIQLQQFHLPLLSTTSYRLFSAAPPEREHPPARIAFFGSDDFSLPTLQRLTSASSSSSTSLPSSSSFPSPSTFPSSLSPLHVEVICPADRRRGRGLQSQPLPVKMYAQQHGLIIHEVAAEIDFRMKGWQLPSPTLLTKGQGGESNRDSQWDLGVIVSFGYFIPAHIISAFPLGMINLHPSLLPKYKGASPIQYALRAGETSTGVSIIDVHPTHMDAGDLLYQQEYPVQATDTFSTLSKRLSLYGADAIMHTIQHLQTLKQHVRQQASLAAFSSVEASLAPRLSNVWGCVDWSSSASAVYNHWRACKGFINAFTTYKGTRVNIVQMTPPAANHRRSDAEVDEVDVGRLSYDTQFDTLFVQCGDGHVIGVSELHLANKPRSMFAHDFANGFMQSNHREKQYFK